MRHFLVLFFCCNLFFPASLFSQGKTSFVNFQILQPGDIKFPAGVKKLILGNRSYQKIFFPDKNKYSGLYELQKLLLSAQSYAVDILQLDSSLRNKNPETVLPPLDWNTVAKLVNNDTTTELIVLEQMLYIRYDYVYQNKYGGFPGYSYKNENGDSTGLSFKNIYTRQYFSSYPYVRTYSSPFLSTVGTGIKTGTQYFWRIYDLKSKKIIDDFEERTTDDYYFRNPLTYGDNPEQYQFMYYNEEISYAYHLLPHWINVHRDYYIDGSADMKTADELAREGNLDGAKIIWKKLSDNPNTKLARKGCYNVAIGYEIDGKLDSAMIYAERSKVLGDKNAPYSIATLRKRIAISEKLNEEINLGEGKLPMMEYYVERH